MKFSILTPSFGYGRFMGSCIASVLSQSDVKVEHIVVDGGSTDSTIATLEQFGLSDSRLRWISEPDRGPSDALNKALQMATGDWIGWLNVDEVYLPGALRAVAANVTSEASSHIGIVHGDFYEMTEAGECMRLVTQHGWSRRALRRGCYIPTCASFFRRESLADPEPWDVGLPSMMDWDLFLRLTSRGVGVRHLKTPLAAFRVHGDQITASDHAQSSEEFLTIRRRHGLPVGGVGLRRVRTEGRAAHVVRKWSNGGYVREWRALRNRSGEQILSAQSTCVTSGWEVENGE